MTRPGDESAAGAAMNDANVPVATITPDMERRARAAICRMVPDEAARGEICEVLFGTPGPARRKLRPSDPRPVQVDPSRSQMPPEDIGAWRAQVCEWGRADGRWPHINSKRALPADLTTAWRKAHPDGNAPAGPPAKPAAASAAHVGDGASPRRLRARMREYGKRLGMHVYERGPVAPELIEAYYAAYPEEA